MHKKQLTICLSFFLLLSSTKNAFCKSVTLPVSGIPNLVPNTVDIPIDWDESAFGRKSAFYYNHGIARMAAIFSDIAYVDVQNEKNNQLYRSYKILGIQDKDIFFKYDVDYNDPEYGIDQCAFSIASKTINSAHGPKTLIFLIIRGTPLGAEEWISNLNLNNSQKDNVDIHEGFSIASKQILFYLDEYIKEHKINTRNSFLLITGHSRGASIANLCSVFLADSKKFLPENIYAYTFASPNVTLKEVSNSNKYKFIWNIVNAEDIVPSMPPRRRHWTFQKYGNTLILVNAWNTDLETYKKNFIPRMNFYFHQFYGKNFSPFKTGPFIPIIITKFLTSNYPETNSFYDGFLHPHDMAANFIKNKVFTGKTPQEQVSNVISVINKTINSDDKLKKRIMESCIDMHTMETYLCWLLALDENEVYSKMGSQIIELQGHQNCAVVNDKDEVVLKIENSKVIFSSIHPPAIAFAKSINSNFIGFPKNTNYRILVSSDSLLQSSFYVEVEEYNCEGLFLGSSTKKEYLNDTKTVYEFSRGNTDKDFPLISKKINSDQSSTIQEKYDLRPDKKFAFHPEFSWDSDNRIMLGTRIGTQQIFGLLLTDFNFHRFGDYLSLWAGIGSQKKLYARFYLDAEVLTNFVYINSDLDSSKQLNFVPALRFSTNFQPRSKKQIFIAALFEFNIDDFNDAAFESNVKRNTIPGLKLGSSLKVYPIIQAGLRF